MAHYLGAFLKYVAALAIFVFSVSLSYTFFRSIEPANMPWFVWSALGLTEFGLLCWLFVFILQRHNPAHKTIALIMIFVCLVAVLYTDAVELSSLFHVSLVVASIYYYALIVLLLAHLLAFVADFFVGYFTKYSFTGMSSAYAQPKSETVRPYQAGYEPQSASFAQTATAPTPKGPGVLSRATSSLAAGIQETADLASEKIEKRRQARKAPVQSIDNDNSHQFRDEVPN